MELSRGALMRTSRHRMVKAGLSGEAMGCRAWQR